MCRRAFASSPMIQPMRPKSGPPRGTPLPTTASRGSYPGLFRDQKQKPRTDGKEVADLLVVFGDEIIIFSDKHCKVPATADMGKDWARWFRRAVQKAAEQAWGAERWIRKFPDRLFLDRECRKQFPFALPDMSRVRFHLIVVAHDIAAHCARALGGSGSLMIHSDVKGFEAHSAPFTVGDLDPKRTFVHVLDDTSLNIVMQTLDTIADFTTYLQKKETLLRSEQIIIAAGEEELLATYLTTIGSEGEHAFTFPANATGIVFGEGTWERFRNNPQRHAQIEANQVSYLWDRLIETFNRHALAGTQYWTVPEGVQSTEQIMRLMAQEPRLRRRLLGASFEEFLRKAPLDYRSSRVMLPSRPGDPFYVFLLLPVPTDRPYEEYREVRGGLLRVYCQIVKSRYPEAQDIVGIATEPGFDDIRSEDAVYLDARSWSDEDQREAKRLQDELQILVSIVEGRSSVKEYPEVVRGASELPSMNLGRNPRNKPCPCGSGRKYKKCHGR
jgi:SEC-C motif